MVDRDFFDRHLTYEPSSGILRWKRDETGYGSNGKVKSGHTAGYRSQIGYIYVTIGQIPYLGHRIAWILMTGSWPDHQIDHINGIRDDNRWENLRQASKRENQRNRRAQINNKLGLKGVTLARSGRYRANICINGKQTSLGTFDTKEAAAAAYWEASITYFGEFSNDGIS